MMDITNELMLIQRKLESYDSAIRILLNYVIEKSNVDEEAKKVLERWDELRP